MNKNLLSAVDMWNVLYETGAHFYANFTHDYWSWLKERHSGVELSSWHGQPARITLIFDEAHDLPPVDSPMRPAVEWLIVRFNLCIEGHPFLIK